MRFGFWEGVTKLILTIISYEAEGAGKPEALHENKRGDKLTQSWLSVLGAFSGKICRVGQLI